jgi:2-dehydro-3-deoxyphosphogluconate aldolase/(4S)-4-hydroxy-2-oxoglutarate aldolase
MKELTALQVMQDAPVIPVIVLSDIASAVPLARALLAGGIRMLEITLRTSQAADIMAAISREVPEVVVGAGTVRNREDVQTALRAGARFLVSPGYSSALGKASAEAKLPLLPGVASASDIMAAMDDGLNALKFFPAQQAGGIAMLKAWSGPFAEVLFCPTGGITPDNAQDYLMLPNVACVGGSWLVPPDCVARQDWNAITQLARQACQLRRTSNT